MADNVFDNEKQRVHDLALRAMEEAVIMIEADVKELCPVKTGALKRSYTHDVREEDSDIIGAVGTNLEYAYWADQKQPHLTQAVDMNRKNIEEKFKSVLSSDK